MSGDIISLRVAASVGISIVVVHVFPKKTQKTPGREIETALRRAKEVK
jgi:phage-related protein